MERETSIWESRRFRVGLIAGISALVALILILQNFDTVEVQFFFWRAEAPLAGLIFTSMLVGAGLQALIRLLWRRKRRQQDRDEQA